MSSVVAELPGLSFCLYLERSTASQCATMLAEALRRPWPFVHATLSTVVEATSRRLVHVKSVRQGAGSPQNVFEPSATPTNSHRQYPRAKFDVYHMRKRKRTVVIQISLHEPVSTQTSFCRDRLFCCRPASVWHFLRSAWSCASSPFVFSASFTSKSLLCFVRAASAARARFSAASTLA